MIQIKELTKEKYNAWDDFVYRHSEASLFHLTSWKLAVEKAFGHRSYYFYAEENGTIRGILPLFRVKSVLFGNIISSVPFAAYGGPVADSPFVFKKLLFKAKQVTKGLGGDYLELKFFKDKGLDLPKSGIYFTFLKELSADHEKNFMTIPRKQRRMVRLGMKAALTPVFSHDYLGEFYKVFAINVRRLGTPVYPKKWFKTLFEVFGDRVNLLVIKYREQVISGVISFYYKDTVFPYYAASLVSFRKYAPSDFQYWMLMRDAVKRGCQFFDFGRSKKGTGHFNYKRHWGFEPKQLCYQYYLNKRSEIPELNPLNPKYRWKIDMWKKLPLGITMMIGPKIVKYIP